MSHRRCFLIAALALLAAALPQASAAGAAGERRTSFNQDWRFLKGEAEGAEKAEFNDTEWRKLELPHDWAIEGPFDRKYSANAGGLPFWGTGWYRKHFMVAAGMKGRYLSLEFDGAMSNAKVWVNGNEVGGRPYGYSSFAVDLTPALEYGKENVVAVRLTPEDQSSRWYPGAGIYRNVWLVTTGPVHVARWGTYITTPEASADRAVVAIRTEVRNRDAREAKVTLETAIVDAQGKQVAHAAATETVAAGGTQSVSQTLDVTRPQRWDMERPYLYQAITQVKSGNTVLDRYVTPFGIRSIEFNAQEGFLLNGRHVKLQGVCNHHDLGALGAAVNRRAIERQLQIMKGMGVNAIRTSHNPPAPELLEYCDRLGLVVMDEAFDMWKIPKIRNGLSKFWDDWGETDLRDMIRRDRNHPSVVMWSIGNEIPEQGRPDGAKLAQRLSDICHEEDRTRPTTAGFNQYPAAIKNGLAAAVDVPGFNYKPTHYAEILKEHPNWVIVGAETASTVSSRGVYHLPIELYRRHESLQVTSYDVVAPPWAYPPDPEFDAQEKLPNVVGEFVWTGFDYLGEPTPYGGRNDWPSRSSYFGIVDLCGIPKDRYFLYKSVWTKEPVLHVLPHWNWAGREGQQIPVLVYTNADEVELFLNGKSLGRKARFSEPVEIPVWPAISAGKTFKSKYRLMWQVPYAAGALTAVGYKNGKATMKSEVRTAGPAARITLTPDRSRIGADGEDLSFVTVRVEDKDGNLCPAADNLVRFKVEGPGSIAAVDNGNAATVEPFQADYRKAFSGMALVIVRSARAKAGGIRLTATSDGLKGAAATIQSR